MGVFELCLCKGGLFYYGGQGELFPKESEGGSCQPAYEGRKQILGRGSDGALALRSLEGHVDPGKRERELSWLGWQEGEAAGAPECHGPLCHL